MNKTKATAMLNVPYDEICIAERRALREYYRRESKPYQAPQLDSYNEIQEEAKRLEKDSNHVAMVCRKLMILGFVFPGHNSALADMVHIAKAHSYPKWNEEATVFQKEWNNYCDLCASNPWAVYGVTFKRANSSLTADERIIKYLTEAGQDIIHSMDNPAREQALEVLDIKPNIPAGVQAVCDLHSKPINGKYHE